MPSPTAIEGAESTGYLTTQLITCIGNKRALLGPIESAIEQVHAHLGRDKLQMLDAFSGSGVVSRLFKRHASRLVSNDIETYASTIARCYLTNRSSFDPIELDAAVDACNEEVERARAHPGFIERLYAPRDETTIEPSDRVFYTRENARRLDRYRQQIAACDPSLHDLLLGPLLSKASVHANTSGVFKGFYKDKDTGIGRYGGSGEHALARIRGRITLEPPTLSRFECDVEVRQQEANSLGGEIGHIDVAYLDPPYNQHPYGSNYFMLNLLAEYEEPAAISTISGIPSGWNRSEYNVRSKALPVLTDLIDGLDSTFILIASSDEGFIAPVEMRAVLDDRGSVTEVTTPYAAFRGSRNLRNRPARVTEHLFMLDKRARGTRARRSASN